VQIEQKHKKLMKRIT